MGMMRALGDLMQRAGLASKLGETFGGDRDLYNAFGYRRSPSFDDYLSYYLRGDIAARVIDVPPKTTWRHAPEIRTEDEAFVEAIEELDDRLRLFHFMQRIDEISGIGQFGILLLGTRGSQITEDPGTNLNPEDLVYIKAYHQGSVEVKQYVGDTSDPRYGQPEIYEVDLAGTTISQSQTKGIDNKKILVPWQRIIHVAENTIEDNVHGQPRLARVLNRVDDLFKVLGGSAELYWQNVGGIWHANIDPDVKVSPEDLKAFEDDIMAARAGLDRLIQTRGVDLDAIAGAPSDPTGNYEALRQVISAAAEIPERVLFGSERGQLAGDQDQKEWQAKIASRQEQYAEPVILRATIDRFVMLGMLKLPTEGYDVDWPALDSPSTEDRAKTAQLFGDAITAVAPDGAADLIVPPWEFRSEFLGLDPVPPEMPEGFDIASGFFDDEEDEDDSGVPPVVPPVIDEDEDEE